MTAITTQGGSIILRNGAIGTEQSCCCEQEDPGRIVKCCYGGFCAETTAAECAFLGGFQVSDCSQCPPVPPGPNGANCTTCCTKPSLDAIITAQTNDIACGAALGSGAGATLFTGRFGAGFKAAATVTLQRNPNNQCNYRFGGCFPLGTFGNFTRFDVSVTFFRRGGNGSCALFFDSITMEFQACFAPDNPRPLEQRCTQPAEGGTCRESFGFNPFNVQSGNVDSQCAVAASTGLIVRTELWPGQSGRSRTLLAAGTPRQRDVGANVLCQQPIAVNSLFEPSFTFSGSAAIRIIG